MKTLQVLLLTSISFLIFSCETLGTLPDNYRKIKEAYNLSKIMSPIKPNAEISEIIDDEIEIRLDKLLELNTLSDLSPNDKTKWNTLFEELDRLSKSEHFAAIYFLHTSDIKAETPRTKRIIEKLNKLIQNEILSAMNGKHAPTPNPYSDTEAKSINPHEFQCYDESGFSFKLKNATPDFITFIKKFATDKDYQLSHIKFPVRTYSSIFHEKDWKFLGTNLIFSGLNKNTQEIGVFEKIKTGYTYSWGEYCSEFVFILTFEKINNKWIMTAYDIISESYGLGENDEEVTSENE